MQRPESFQENETQILGNTAVIHLSLHNHQLPDDHPCTYVFIYPTPTLREGCDIRSIF